MSSVSIYDWMTQKRVERLLGETMIASLTQDFYYYYGDGDEEGEEELFLDLALPLTQRYFQDLIDIDNEDIEDCVSAEEYVKYHAIAVLKAQILEAAQAVFKFPLWECRNGLAEMENGLENAELWLEDSLYDKENIFVSFFPVLEKKYKRVPFCYLEWAVEVVREFLDMARIHHYYLSDREILVRRAQARNEVLELEKRLDTLCETVSRILSKKTEDDNT